MINCFRAVLREPWPVALLQSPIKNVVSQLQSGANTITGVLKTLEEKKAE